MQVDPCAVCGGTDLNLVDGFYYCVECGTQDVNARETVVEHTMLADGTFAHAASRKFTTVLKEGIKMSGEWYKWHTFNFILCGLADELVALGARPSFKVRVLWVWARYIKEFQVKEDERETSELLDGGKRNNTKASIHESENDEENKSSKKRKRNGTRKDISIITKNLILAILYSALNLDQSDIQLSHLFRYIRGGRLSILNCNKFIPKELNLKSIPHWNCFLRCTRINNPDYVRYLAMALFKGLDLGKPLVPDLNNIIDNYIKEMSLPNDFRNLVFSVIHLAPCDFLYVENKKGLVRIPDYEGVAMSYLLVALKMCFGLDDAYEIELSKVVDKINEDECYMKSHKLGMISEPTDRLFSFREWCNYLQFRKIMLCKYYLPMAKQHNLDVDDYVFMEQSGDRPKRKIELSDEVTMDILNKIRITTDPEVIPITEFLPSLTPISTYTEVIIQYVQDPELKLLISEDFTQYSLKYACVNLNLVIHEQNVVTGVSETNKIVKPAIVGTLVSNKADFKMVYVRNCENKNWLITKPPTVDHIIIDEDCKVSDKDSNPGYNSNVDNISVEVESKANNTERNIEDNIETEKELEAIREEDKAKFIFDDLFEDVIDDKMEEAETELEHNSCEFDFQNSQADIYDGSDTCNLSVASFNPKTFNREKVIKELILNACKKYKIPIPREYNPKEPRKRKQPLVHIGAGQSDAKRRKIGKKLKPGEAKKVLNRIFAAYYTNLEKGVLNQVSDHVNNILQNLQIEGLAELEEELYSKSSITLNDSISSNHNETVNQVYKHESENNDELTNVDGLEDDENNVTTDDNTDILPKINPEFDTKTYDASQLYVKFKEEVKLDDILDFDDPELEKLLDSKILEINENKPIELGAKDLKKPKKYNSDSDSDDDDDDIPLAHIVEEKHSRERKLQDMKNWDPLIKNPGDIKNFKYWFRHYTTASIAKNLNMHQRFDLELEENCPSSFNFVIHECAAILDCTTYSLYKYMQDIEQLLIFKGSKEMR